MGTKDLEGQNRRIKDRKHAALRVDVKILPQKEVEDILDGAGYTDLSVNTLSMTRPRSGMKDSQTLDLSSSGLGLRCKELYNKGMAAALDLHLPGDRTVLKFLGEVIWATEVGGEPRAGFRIAALDESSAQRFCGYLQGQS